MGLAFVDDLGRHGDAPALIEAAGRSLSHAELDQLVDETVASLGPGRQLVLVPMTTSIGAIVSYLACLRGGHVALVSGEDPAAISTLVEAFDPDAVVDPPTSCEGGPVIHRRRGAPRHDLHPELAALLSTSGSTGSPKLVRLSRTNLDSNATAIAAALDLQDTDRAISSLPLHYCYGLSVLHSHLTVGGAVVLTTSSVVDPCFWDAVDRNGVTTLAGVPHSFELLDRSPVALGEHPSLRLMTQAGGRLRPELVHATAVDAARHGIDFRVMYGQTEATARIAITPAGIARDRPGVVGRAVPGCAVRVEAGTGDHPAGELVVDGPGVMMGYATAPSDLARGRDLDVLRTGDLARLHDDGMIEIVGRKADFVKLFGLRVDLRRVADMLADDGITAHVTGDDDGLAVAVLDHHDPGAVRAALSDRLSLPAAAVTAARTEDVPRLANGKVDRAATIALVRGARPGSTPDDGRATVPGRVHRVFADVLGADAVCDDDTFVSLGGDSLSYVEASVRLEAALGHLPDGWHLLTVGELAASDQPTSRWARVETSVLIRAVAIVLIVGNHAGAFLVPGGAHVLLAGAGFNLARFQVAAGAPWRSIVRLAVPAVTWIGAMAAVRDDFDLAHALLLHGWVGGDGRWAYWFVEALAQLLAVAAVVLAVPGVRRWERRRPFLLPAVLLVPALLVRFDIVDLGEHHRHVFRPHEVAWIFLLGWLAERADTTGRRLAVSGLVLAAVPGFFGDPTRELVLAGGLLVLTWIPHLPLPRPAVPAVGALAGASLWIYLTHYQVHPVLSPERPVLAVLASVVVGIAAWRVLDPPLARVADRIIAAGARMRRPRSPEHDDVKRDTVGA